MKQKGQNGLSTKMHKLNFKNGQKKKLNAKLNFYIGEFGVSSSTSSSSKSCTTMWRLYFVSSVVTKLHFAHANFGEVTLVCFFFREILVEDFVVALGVSSKFSGLDWDDDEVLGVSCEVTPLPLDFISTTLLQRKFVYSTTKNISRILKRIFDFFKNVGNSPSNKMWIWILALNSRNIENSWNREKLINSKV